MKKTLILALALMMGAPAFAQFGGPRIPNFKSTEVLGEGKVAFRIYAPEAKKVNVTGDLPYGKPIVFTKAENGVWEAIAEGIEPGYYRYSFVVDGVTVYDPKAENASETKAVLKVEPKGDEFFAMRKDVEHGAIAQRYYWSDVTNSMRRMHVWTPAGYEKDCKKLPVFYLIHGGGDTDNSWPGVGAAGNILDNLYAAGNLEPMIVVMPNGSIQTDTMEGEVPLFVKDLMTNIVPFVEKNYNVYTDAAHKALGGLSMGGWETLNTMLEYYDQFTYFYVFSSGWFPTDKALYEKNGKILKDIAKDFNKKVKYLLFTQGGPEDIAYNNCKAMLEQLFDPAGIKYEYSEGPGGHSWYTWRRDLNTFAPKLFRK